MATGRLSQSCRNVSRHSRSWRARRPVHSASPSSASTTALPTQAEELNTVLLQADARVDQGVADVRENLTENEEQRADVNHHAQRGKVVAEDGIHGEGAEPRDAEARLEQQGAHEQKWNFHHHV